MDGFARATAAGTSPRHAMRLSPRVGGCGARVESDEPDHGGEPAPGGRSGSRIALGAATTEVDASEQAPDLPKGDRVNETPSHLRQQLGADRTGCAGLKRAEVAVDLHAAR